MTVTRPVKKPKSSSVLSAEHNCERFSILKKLKNARKYCFTKRVIKPDVTKNYLDQTVQDIRDNDCKDMFVKDGMKHVSEWMPSYVNFEPGKHPLIPFPMSAPKARILSSDLITSCYCLKRNGLQEDCPHLQCKGLSECLTHPIPTCLPSGLGKAPAKPVRISRPAVVACDPKECRKNAKKKNEEKKARDEMYIKTARRFYMDIADMCKVVPCKRHDGTFVRKPLNKDATTQIGEVLCYCMAGRGDSKLKSVEKEQEMEKIPEVPSKLVNKMLQAQLKECREPLKTVQEKVVSQDKPITCKKEEARPKLTKEEQMFQNKIVPEKGVEAAVAVVNPYS